MPVTAILTADGTFAFRTALASGTAYAVTIKTPPSFPAQSCVATSASGTLNANVTNVSITCAALPGGCAGGEANVHSVSLTWNDPGAASFNVYLSSARDCDIANYTSCPGGALLSNVTSPKSVTGLLNGQAHFFKIESIYANGAHGLSNEAGARPNNLSFDSLPGAIASAADGTNYVGGYFSRVGITTGSAVLLDASTGRDADPDFPVVDGLVAVIAPDGTGGWYLGGDFGHVGGIARNNLVHVLVDGAVDTKFARESERAGQRAGGFGRYRLCGRGQGLCRSNPETCGRDQCGRRHCVDMGSRRQWVGAGIGGLK